MNFDPSSAQPVDAFDPTSAVPDEGPTTRQVLRTAVQTNPDDAAEAERLAKRYPAPNDVLLRNLRDVKLQEAVDTADERLGGSPKLAELMRQSPFTAKQAHDDLDPLAQIEKFFSDVGGSAKAGVFRASRGSAGVFQAGLEFVAPVLDPLESVTEIGGNPLRRLAEGFAMSGAGAGETAKAARPKVEGDIANGFFSGIESLTQNILALPMAFVSPPAALTFMSATTGGDSYQSAREKGLPMSQALPYAVSQAAIEYATEKLPLGALIGDVKAGTPIFETLVRQMALEIPGEQIATVLQDLNEWAVLNPEKPFSRYLEERPSAAAQTLVATIVGVGGNVAVVKGIETMVNRGLDSAQEIENAERAGQGLEQALKIASQSKLRERNPETFQQLVRQMAEQTEGAPQTVFIDAEVLMQSSTPEQIAQLLPSTADQLEAAIASNGMVEVPIAEVMTFLPGTPLEQVFLQNARAAQNSLSMAEAKQASDQAEQFIKTEADRVMAEAQDQEAWQASTEVVKTTLLEQLNTAGRFTPEVNEAYATLVRDFYAVTASRVGLTPEQLYAKYPLRVTGVQPGQGAPVLNRDETVRPGAIEVEGYQYSTADRPVISTAMFGTGLQGSGREQYLTAADTRLRKRAYFYVDKGTGINPESGVGGRAMRAKLANVYDSNADPLRLKAGRDQLGFESAVLDAGFSGYLDRLDGTQSGQVIMLGNQNIPAEPLGAIAATRGAVVPPPQRTAARGRDAVVEALQARTDLPMGQPTRESWQRLLRTAAPAEYAALEEAGVFLDRLDERLYRDELMAEYRALTEPELYEQSGREGGDTSFADRARALLDTKPTPALATTDIVDGKVESPVFKNITELAAHFTKKNRGKTKDLADPKVQARIADAIYAETLHGLTDAGNAIGWYDRKTRAALAIITEVHPELATDAQSRFAFIALLAVTSNGLRSRDNFVIAEQLYREGWKVNGQFPELVPQGGPRAVAMGETFALLNRKVAELGWAPVRDFMASKHTAKEVRDFAGAASFFGEQAASVVPGALFLGPKLGSFFNNLYGDFSTVTMDRWFMRTMNRVRGRMLSLPSSFGKNLATLREQVQAGTNTFGVKPEKLLADIAAFEQFTPEQQEDVIYVRSKLKALQTYTRARHRDYAKPRDDGTGKKRSFLDRTPENYLAKNLDLALTGSNDAPSNASDRTWIRGIMDQVQARLAADGVTITNADLQAVLWYYEKDLYDRLIGSGQEVESESAEQDVKEAEDYETAARYAVARLQRQGLAPGSAGSARSETADAGTGDPAAPAEAGGLTDGPQATGGEPTAAGTVPLDGGVPGSAGVLDQPRRPDSQADQPLAGLPAVVTVDGQPVTFGPFQLARDAARRYAERAGLTYDPPTTYEVVDPARAKRLADAFEAMEHDPTDPETKAAYEALIAETVAQWQAIKETGLVVEFIDGPDPYGNPRNAILDVVQNNHLWVYPTDAGFGGTESASVDISGNPLLAVVEGETISGRPVRANDIFRIVHDYFGHVKEGVGFRAEGEENAWQQHMAMFSPLARRALTTETRGQNSWVNFGPFAEFNKTAGPGETQYAPQKIGLLPVALMNEGYAGEQNRPLEQSPIGRPTFETTYTDEQGETYEIRLEQETMGLGADRQLTVNVGAFQGNDRRARVNFAVQGNTLAAENTMTAPASRRKGLAEAMYRAAREAGYDIMPGREQTDDGAKMVQRLRDKGLINRDRPLEQGPRGTFSPSQMLITLGETADLSTFLHESGHFFLEVTADLASQPGAPVGVAEDMARTLKWFGVADLATWNAMTLDQKRPYHEKWAESFEQYLFEGKAPNAELQPLFRRFRSWMVNVYKSLTQFMRGRNLQVDDEIRQVFDRMIATDEAIAAAEETAGMLPEFDATNEAIEALQVRSMRDLKWTVNARNKAIKKLQAQAKELRKGIEAEVRAEVMATPEMRSKVALDAMRKSTPESKAALKAWQEQREQALEAAREEIKANLLVTEGAGLKGLQKGQFLAKNKKTIDNQAEARVIEWEKSNPKPARQIVGSDEQIATIAEAGGYATVEQMMQAIDAYGPADAAVEGMTDQRMLERHGDLVDERAVQEAANEAVHNEARARSLATELKAQAAALNPRQQTGTASNGRPVTTNALVEAAKQFAANLTARRRIKDLKSAAAQHRAAEARAAKKWTEATAKGDTQGAIQAKRDQLLNNLTAKAMAEAQAEIKKTLEFFAKVTKGSNEKIVERGRDPDVVNAMRAILAAYDVAPRLEKAALEYMESVQRNDPAMFNALQPSVVAAMQTAKPLREMTMEELRGLTDELRAMWELAKRSRQMEVDGNLIDIEDAAAELVTRMQEIGVPNTIPGEGGAITDAQERGIKLRFFKAILSRVEQWAERLDGKFGGPFLRLVFQPVKDAADRYRTDRIEYRRKFTALLQNLAPAMPKGPIAAPELGYTFGNARDSGTAELLHAILHTGNDSNKRKLLLGRGWATENPDGTLDTARWDAFLQRMYTEGKLAKVHYDFAQGVWDLLEQMKPLAQETHRKVYGRYFAEITANEVVTPFGNYAGGYVPAQTDSRIVKDAKLRELADGENESMAYAFPSSPNGFTKGRVEYNKPLLLDLRAMAQHMDKVLLFSHMQGAATDVRRLLTQKGVSYALDRIDPSAYEGMLIPWLNRAAKQIVETPIVGDRKLSRFLSAARNRAGMALMFANLSNTFQQITGFSLASVKVKPSLMLKATAEFTRSPKAMKETVAEASPYMRDRMLNEVSAMSDAVEQILIDPTLLERSQAWTQRHAYFLQSAVDNTMSPIIWTAGYNQALEQGMSERDAIRFADSVVRQTQGTTLPEDISRFESGPAYGRVFTQFVSYFNMMANTNATAVKQIVDEMGMRKGAGKITYVALAGLFAPIWVAEAIAHAFRGGPEDEDDDGYLDDWLVAVFGLGTIRGLVATVPIVGQAAQLVVNRFNDNPADDKFSLSPAVSLIESTVSAPASVYSAIVDDGNKVKAARDVAAAATMVTGLPIYGAARPLFYLTGIADDKIEPTGPVDFARGLITGTASPDSKQ